MQVVFKEKVVKVITPEEVIITVTPELAAVIRAAIGVVRTTHVPEVRTSICELYNLLDELANNQKIPTWYVDMDRYIFKKVPNND